MATRTSPSLGAEDRFLTSLAKTAHTLLVEQGHDLMFEDRLSQAATEAGAPDHVALHVAGQLEEQGLIWREGRTYKVLSLAVWYEKSFDREGFRSRNALRREALKAAAHAFEAGEPRVQYWETSGSVAEGERSFTDAPYSEAIWAVRLLEHDGLLELTEYLGRHFMFKVTPSGYSLTQDERALKAMLPLTATEDEAAHAAIAPDAAEDVIRSCEQMLETRGWVAAREELARGDAQYREGHWVDAVREYYAALESGLTHRLDEAGASYGDGSSLRVLVRAVAEAGLMPPNYQATFGFLDSIRSPRSHGRGSKPAEVPVGPAEALLAGNLVRALLLYLGHLPRK